MNINGGLGCKSALAYTDHFYIETYTIEEEIQFYRKWVQYIDISKIGAIDLLEEEINPPEFKQGTKISIAFEQKDYDKLLSSLSLYLTYTKSNYNFINKEIFNILNLSTTNYNYYGENWALKLLSHYDARKTYLVVIEGIPYKLDIKVLFNFIEASNSNLDYILNKYKPNYISHEENKRIFHIFLSALEFCSFEIKINIGTVDVSASREALQYTDKTCTHLYKDLYLLFIEFYKYIEMDCLSHPDVFTASRNFYKYPSFFFNLFVKDLYWKKHKVYFNKHENMFSPNPSNEFKIYKLEQFYCKKQQQYVDGLKNNGIAKIYINEKRYIICVQDSKYSKYSKYIKYYLDRNIDPEYKHRTIAICIYEKDLECLEDWFKSACPILKISDLINLYNKECPPQKIERLESSIFKCFKLVDYIGRPRARHLFQYTKEATVLKEPNYINYFISMEEFYSLSLSKRIDEYCLWSSFKNNLFTYFKCKELEGDIFICEKETRNYKHKNWINLLSLILEDCNKFNIDTKEFKGTELNKMGLNLFRYGFIKNHLPLFYLFKKSDLNKNSYYSYIQDLYIESQVYLNNNILLHNLTNLINTEIYDMTDQLSRKYISEFNSFKVPEYIKNKCKEFFDICKDYQTKLPFLQTYNIRNRYYSDFDILKHDYLFYINLMERELNLYKIKNSEEVIIPNTPSEFSLLCSKLIN